MKVKYIIHRSKRPFGVQKSKYRKILEFYQDFYPGLKVIDKGLRFSLHYDDILVDFDFGYLNMRYRDFSAYNLVVSHSFFGILDRALKSGDIVFPTRSDLLRINSAGSKIRLYDKTSQVPNRMHQALRQMERYEEAEDLTALRRFLVTTFEGQALDEDLQLATFGVREHGYFVETNSFFIPSRLVTDKAVLRKGGRRIEISNVQEHLEDNFQGTCFEVQQMMDNAGPKLFMFAVGLDKPYAGVELSDEIRFSESAARTLPGYDERRVQYFIATFLACLLQGKVISTEGSSNPLLVGAMT